MQLFKLQRTILDPKSHPIDLNRAGCEFVKILRGNQYKPSQDQVFKIISLIQLHPNVSLDHLIMVSETFQAAEKQNEKKSTVARIEKNH